jgi:hypothetical protein
MFKILLGLESFVITHGISTVSSSIVKVLFTACTVNFELTFKLTSSSVKFSSGKVIVIFCNDPCLR